ncbi:Uncharacterized protein PBTT_05217 [Plasmodiophora brassicae]|uniref:Uncharacterized protein n=1 Tax=Plasmodiophora brassicae TaxID=37360 RepID=A0A0G4IR47_PLABS|nr:hypothetical protein PBRA_001002 [Plasmodiophora brassicae]
MGTYARKQSRLKKALNPNWRESKRFRAPGDDGAGRRPRRQVARDGGGRHRSTDDVTGRRWDEGVVPKGWVPRTPPTTVFQSFVNRPNVAAAVGALKQETDPLRGWTIHTVMLDDDFSLHYDYFWTMLAFCARCLPTKAPEVARELVYHKLKICDVLFDLVVRSCRIANPPLVDDAIDVYFKHGPRSVEAVASIISLCREAEQPQKAFLMLPEALTVNAIRCEDVLMDLAACCMADGGPMAADVAEQVLDVIQVRNMQIDEGIIDDFYGCTAKCLAG